MYRNLTILFFVIFISQNSSAQTKEQSVESRVTKHYSLSQIRVMKYSDPKKIQRLNYYYSNSFYVVPNDKHIGECPKIDLKKFDVTPYERLRKADEEVVITLTDPGDFIILRSQNYMKDAYAKIVVASNE